MHLSDYIILFCAIFICFLLGINLSSQVATASDQLNREYSNYVTSACQAAVQSAHTENIQSRRHLWDSRKELNDSIDSYINVLSRCLRSNGENEESKDIARISTPVIMFIDNDGYYIAYNRGVSGNSENTYDGKDLLFDVSEINTFSETKEVEWGAIKGIRDENNSNKFSFIYRYYLDGGIDLTITADKPESYDNGSYWDEIPEAAGIIPEGSRFWHFSDKSDAEKKLKSLGFYENNDSPINTLIKNICPDEGFIKKNALEQVNSKFEYYLDNMNCMNERYSLGYQVEMPKIEGEDWARMVAGPTVVGFLQGKQISHNTSFLNVYAYAGGELTRSGITFCYSEKTDGITVHRSDCPQASSVKNKFDNMKDLMDYILIYKKNIEVRYDECVTK